MCIWEVIKYQCHRRITTKGGGPWQKLKASVQIGNDRKPLLKPRSQYHYSVLHHFISVTWASNIVSQSPWIVYISKSRVLICEEKFARCILTQAYNIPIMQAIRKIHQLLQARREAEVEKTLPKQAAAPKLKPLEVSLDDDLGTAAEVIFFTFCSSSASCLIWSKFSLLTSWTSLLCHCIATSYLQA